MSEFIVLKLGELGKMSFGTKLELGDVSFRILTFLMNPKNGPKSTSRATASKTRLAPIMLLRLALKVANRTPIATMGGQTLMVLM